MPKAKLLAPLHPGEILREEFLLPLRLSAGSVAKAAGIPRTRIERIMREETGISADTALRLGRIFGMSADFWMNLQSRFDLQTAAELAGADIAAIKELRAA